MDDKEQLEISLTDLQKTRLMQHIGINADGITVDKETGKITLINPRSVSAFRLDKDQQSALKDALGKEVEGMLIDPVTFGVDLVTAGSPRVQMWGEYRD